MYTDLQEMKAPASVVIRVKRNSADSSHPLLQGQEDSKIRGVKNIGIISTPIVWPVKQRPLYTSKFASTEKQSPERKNAPTYFMLTAPEVAASSPGDTQVHILGPFTEQVNIDHSSSMAYSIFSNISGHSNAFVSENGDSREMPTIPLDHIRNIVLPLQESERVETEPIWTWAPQLEDPASDSVLPSLVSKNTLYDLTEASELALSSNGHALISAYKNAHSFIRSLSTWYEFASYNYAIFEMSKENHPSISIKPSIHPSVQETRLDFLERSLENDYLEPTQRMLEEGSVRNSFYNVGELQPTKFNYIKGYNSVHFKKQVFKQSANPSGYLQNMKAWFPDVMPNIQPTEILLPVKYSTELHSLSAALLTTKDKNSEIQQSVSVSYLHQENFHMASLKGGLFTIPPLNEQLEHTDKEASSPEGEFGLLSTFISFISDVPPSLIPFENIKSKPSTFPGAVESNKSDNPHNDVAFSTVDPKSMNKTNMYWKPSYLNLPTQYMASASSGINYWTLEQEPSWSSKKSTERWLISSSQSFSPPADRVSFFSSPTKINDISMQTTPNNSTVGYGTEAISISASESEKEKTVFRPVILMPSSRISESMERTLPLERNADNPLKISVPIKDVHPLHFPFSSLKMPVIQPSLHSQIRTSDILHEQFMNELKNIGSLTMQEIWDITLVNYVINSSPYLSEMLTPFLEPLCTDSNHHACTMPSQSPINSKEPSQFQNMHINSQNIWLTKAPDDVKDKKYSFVNHAFLEKQNLQRSNLFTRTQSMEIPHTHNPGPQVRASPLLGSSSAALSVSLVSQSLLSSLDQNSNSSSYLWNEDPKLQANPIKKSSLTDIDQQSAEDSKNKVTPSLQLHRLEMVDSGIDGSITSIIDTTVLEEESLWKVHHYSSNNSNSSVNKERTYLNPSNVQITDLHMWTISSSFKDFLDYEEITNYTSIWETNTFSVVTEMLAQSTPFVEPINYLNENALNNTEIMTGGALHELQAESSAAVPELEMSRQPLTSVVPGISQSLLLSATQHPSTGTPKSVLSCFLCNSFIDWGCPCGSEVNHSMSKPETRFRKISSHLLDLVYRDLEMAGTRLDFMHSIINFTVIELV